MSTESMQINRIYEEMADDLNISDSEFEKAERSYKSVGKCIGDNELIYDVQIFPQGSINLGTIIKPITDKDEYDIDLVCLLKGTSNIAPADLKKRIAKHLNSNAVYEKMLEPEGKRCWKLQYENYHMDILPSIPSGLPAGASNTAIKITDTKNFVEYRYIESNPEAYKQWFVKRMQNQYDRYLKEYAIRAQVDIKNVPMYRVRTPLQKAIQILKRHRDISYSSDEIREYKPISCIITTLAAKAYLGEDNTFDSLKRIFADMNKYIEVEENGYFKIANPTLESENLADKWRDNPRLRDEFFRWQKKAENDLVIWPERQIGLSAIGDHFKQNMGTGITERVFTHIAEADNVALKEGKLKIDCKTGLLSANGSIISPPHRNFGNG